MLSPKCGKVGDRVQVGFKCWKRDMKMQYMLGTIIGFTDKRVVVEIDQTTGYQRVPDIRYYKPEKVFLC